jgi:hypothetical protein
MCEGAKDIFSKRKDGHYSSLRGTDLMDGEMNIREFFRISRDISSLLIFRLIHLCTSWYIYKQLLKSTKRDNKYQPLQLVSRLLRAARKSTFGHRCRMKQRTCATLMRLTFKN